ncbi:MAG: type II toxin-antitoxin system VapC family toxin [Gemmatimonadota bacterium]|jgi:predicted nucleic acid-binding protein
MAAGLVLGCDFLADLEREVLRGVFGAAHQFLDRNAEQELCITRITAGELASGPQLDERNAWSTFVSRFRILDLDLDAAWAYGQTYRYLKHNDLLIGTNDLWTAAVAVVRGLPLVTRNPAHFRRVPGLKVLTHIG